MNAPSNPVNPDDIARVIVLVYGVLGDGRQFWCYVAVRPSKYNDFMDAQKSGSLNLFEFDPFGEIIISGEGTRPPDEVTLKVAEVYQTDPSKFFKPIDPQAEVQKKVQEYEAKKSGS